jgi:tRNA threonylcarbamoyladenosine biosynthesis protein TsaE
MEQHSLIISSLDKIKEITNEFLRITKGQKHFAFYGDMGVGKTTFIKQLCKDLGVGDVVNSPSFAIINEYSSFENGSIFHFDLYRINNIEEAYDFGYEDYFFGDSFCFVEWPEKIESLIPDHFMKVKLTEIINSQREIQFPI